jgi:hypothetical protein
MILLFTMSIIDVTLISFFYKQIKARENITL